VLVAPSGVGPERSQAKGVKLKTSQLGRTTLSLTALLTSLSACSSGSLTHVGTGVAQFAVAPAAPQLAPGAQLQFAVTSADVGQVTWAVAETNGGTIDAAGHYTAPDIEGQFTVVAASGAQQRSASVHVTRNPTVATTSTPVGTTPAGTTPAGTTPAGTTPAVTTGAGTTLQPAYLTGVTGGGAMPDWSSNVVTAACKGDGVTDDTACLQAAANAARDQQKPLVIPATTAFYAINGPFTVYTSVGGVGGTPTIKQTSTSATYPMQKMIVLGPSMTGWIYNLHLVGTFDGNPADATTEHGHQIDVGTVNGVTIKGNLLENAMGDSISSDIAQYDGGTLGQNVLVDGNTMRNPYRCAVGFIYNQQNWVVTNNLVDKQVNFVSGIDFEPENGGAVYHVEIAYNKFVMNNQTVNPDRGVDGMAVSGWHVPNPPTATAGGDYYIHHNYGTFGTGFSAFGNGGWGNIYQASNVAGAAVPQ
jgi:hypothetical protein